MIFLLDKLTSFGATTWLEPYSHNCWGVTENHGL